MSGAVLVVSATSAFVGLGAPAAWADAPVDRGWWTVANPGSPVPPPPPPDVPADGLLVQGGAPDAPAAFAGLIYEPIAGATAERLVLKVVSSSATTPGAVLQLCPLKSPALNAAQGGPMADAPAYDCSRKVTAPPDAEGAGYSFDLSSLSSVGPVALAVLPTAPSDRVVLANPGADSLVTSAPPLEFSPAPFPSEPAATPGASAPVALPPFSGTGGLPGLPASGSTAPEAPVVALSPTPAHALATVGPITQAAGTSSDHHAALGGALLALLAAGCGLWAFAGRGPGLDDAPAAD